MKALYAFPHSIWDDEIMKIAEKIYYQRDKIYDSSARAIAIDIIIDSKPSLVTLRHLMKSLQSNTSYETRKYLLQRLQQAASLLVLTKFNFTDGFSIVLYSIFLQK